MVQGRGPGRDCAAGREILLLHAAATTHTSTAMDALPVLGRSARRPARSTRGPSPARLGRRCSSRSGARRRNPVSHAAEGDGRRGRGTPAAVTVTVRGDEAPGRVGRREHRAVTVRLHCAPWGEGAAPSLGPPVRPLLLPCSSTAGGTGPLSIATRARFAGRCPASAAGARARGWLQWLARGEPKLELCRGRVVTRVEGRRKQRRVEEEGGGGTKGKGGS
jgi:hypothetical protein